MQHSRIPLSRQSMFIPDGTITDIPTKLTETPDLERQVSLIDYYELQHQLAKFCKPINSRELISQYQTFNKENFL
jgi:hypothetical protein